VSAAAVGFEPVADVARRNGTTVRCMKRRLKRYAERVRLAFPAESPLLVQFGGGRYFVDRSVAWRHARGLIVDGADEPWEEALRALRESAERVEAMHAETLDVLASIKADTGMTRDHLAAAS